MQRRHALTALAGLAVANGRPGGARAAVPAGAEPVDETWTDPVRQRDLPLRLRWPAGDGPCALVLHSHGLGGSRLGAAAWGEAWQAAGLAVLHLQHPGSDSAIWQDGVGGVRRGAAPGQYLARVADAHFVLDELQRRRAAGGAWRRVRLDAIGFSGHSFGARLTLGIAGERPPRAPRAWVETLADPRPRAFIAFSPGFDAGDGTDDATVKARFGAIARPFLCITGTLDDAMIVGDATHAARRAVYRGLPPGRKAELVLAGADHMTFGGGTGLPERPGGARLLRRAPGAAQREPAQRRVVAALSADWWRAELLGDVAAQARLREPEGLEAGDLWQRG